MRYKIYKRRLIYGPAIVINNTDVCGVVPLPKAQNEEGVRE
jgi:hypothetical protein